MDMVAAFTQIAIGFSAISGGPFDDALVHSPGVPTMDLGGSISSAGTATQRTCQAQIDSVTQAMRESTGYAEGDMRIIILAATLAGAISTDDRVEILAGPFAGLWMIEHIGIDTLGIGYELRGRRA